MSRGTGSHARRVAALGNGGPAPASPCAVPAGARDRTSRPERLDARVAWLRKRPALVDLLPGLDDEVTVARAVELARTRTSMVEHGLYAPTARRVDVSHSIRAIVSALREEAHAPTDR